MRRFLGSQAALSGMLCGGVRGGSGRGEEACEGQQTLGGPLTQFIWLTWISKNF